MSIKIVGDRLQVLSLPSKKPLAHLPHLEPYIDGKSNWNTAGHQKLPLSG